MFCVISKKKEKKKREKIRKKKEKLLSLISVNLSVNIYPFYKTLKGYVILREFFFV